MKTIILGTLIALRLLIMHAENIPDALITQDIKQNALSVLENKCNVCHKKQNPFKVFSAKNMNKHADKINTQVFIEKRMPKGNTIVLTPQEYQTLKSWLNSLNINTDGN